MESKRYEIDRYFLSSGRPGYLESVYLTDLKKRQDDQEILTVLSDKLLIDKKVPFQELMDRIEKEIIIQALLKFDGNQRKTARFLGLKANTLNFKIKKHGIGFIKLAV